MAKKKQQKIIIDKEKCKGCLLCINVCPQAALELSRDLNKKGLRYAVLRHAEKCTRCTLCAVVCPDCAIEVPPEEKE